MLSCLWRELKAQWITRDVQKGEEFLSISENLGGVRGCVWCFFYCCYADANLWYDPLICLVPDIKASWSNTNRSLINITHEMNSNSIFLSEEIWHLTGLFLLNINWTVIRSLTHTLFAAPKNPEQTRTSTKERNEVHKLTTNLQPSRQGAAGRMMISHSVPQGGFL